MDDVERASVPANCSPIFVLVFVFVFAFVLIFVLVLVFVLVDLYSASTVEGGSVPADCSQAVGTRTSDPSHPNNYHSCIIFVRCQFQCLFHP